MYPMKLKAPLKDYLWGGVRLKTDFGKQSDLEKVAESWELSCHKDGASVIENGAYAGKTLAAVLAENGNAMLGKNGAAFEQFPVLIKLIDAKDNLSVQVHPDNAYAQRVEGEYGKTEMWYIVDCDEGASLLYGFKQEISEAEFRRRIADNTLLDVVNAVPVKKGDVFFIEAGTLHAIGKGILIAEIQQNSNTTYRIYDYGRVGADGKPRALHVDKAVDVTRRTPPTRGCAPEGAPERCDGYVKTLLARCPYFTVHTLEIQEQAALAVGADSFHSLLCLDGAATLTSDHGDLEIRKGESVFLPADFGAYTLTGQAKMIQTTV